MNESVLRSTSGQLNFPGEHELGLFANKFASDVSLPLVIWLEGDLGTGKTAFARGLIHALGYQDRVKSPTYGLLEHYQMADVQVLHMDLYRISEPGELEFLGIEDLLDERSILLVEWPDKGGSFLPRPDFVFNFTYAGEGRDLHWSALTAQALSIPSGAFDT